MSYLLVMFPCHQFTVFPADRRAAAWGQDSAASGLFGCFMLSSLQRRQHITLFSREEAAFSCRLAREGR